MTFQRSVVIHKRKHKLYKQHDWQDMHSGLHTEYRKENAKNITYHKSYKNKLNYFYSDKTRIAFITSECKLNA